MKKVIFEFPSITAGFALEHPLTHPTSYYSCHQVLRSINSITGSSLHLIPITCNSPAIQIATSVIRDHRYRSYVARLGPIGSLLLFPKRLPSSPKSLYLGRGLS
ncbi:hypothetical protein F2Q68_00005784 [Brassica cretica]|uniref:Uncharacterized protein n=1 Tax=Brassica cretica TaxID=69181 RepID=A0A8S9JBN7_BRACR|nr:hypothetical protein F2Q68_00005784 [Brassica cretica]